jgi:Protein of unknown function (DUF1569)
MKSMFDPPVATEVRDRLATLRPDSARVWGKMIPAQAMAHCAISLESATGQRKLKRVFIGRLIGPLVKRLALSDDKPMVRNSPTAPELVVADERNFDVERARVAALVDQFAAAGPAGCTTRPHAFFGSLTPDEWGALMYKHLDHHLRQFGV